MSLPQAQLFEDECPLFRSCPALNELRIAEEFKDLIIEVEDGARLHAHRIILAARIPSLRACLSCPPGEEMTILRWPSVPLSLANSLLHYAYTGQVEITQSNVRAMVSFARMIQLPVLENWGAKFLISNINTGNLETTLEFARSLNIGIVKNACFRWMKFRFENFVNTNLFIRLPADTVLELIRSNDLVVRSEEQVFDAISRWTGASKDEEDEKLRLNVPAMLKEVQWQQTTAPFRDRLLRSHQIFKKNGEYALLMARIINWIGAADKDAFPCPFNQNIRLRPAIFVFGRLKNRNQWSVLRFDSQMQNEEVVAEMEARSYATYSVVGGSIFVVGGWTPQQVGVKSVKEFIVRERRWRPRAPLACRRQQHAAVVVGIAAATNGEDATEKKLIGIFGGYFKEGNTWTYLSSCELYDITEDRWHNLPDLRPKRGGPAAACLPGDSRVFVFGGDDNSLYHDSVVFCELRADWRERVTTATTAEFWIPAAHMRTARSNLTAAPLREKILVAGGENSEGRTVNFVEIFSPPDPNCPLGQWTEVAGMKQCRKDFYLLTTGDAIFALGNSVEPWNTVEAFVAPDGSEDMGNDFKDWIWSTMRPVETLAANSGAAILRL